MVIGVGRPLVLLVVGVGIMVIGNARLAGKLLADTAWTTRILGNIAGVLLTVGAAGGLQRLCQETGMAELLGERSPSGIWRLASWRRRRLADRVSDRGDDQDLAGLVAGRRHHRRRHRAAAADPARSRRRECAARSPRSPIGAGAMTVSHINDDYFWLVSVGSGIRPLRALAALTAGTLLQGVVAVAMLMILFMPISSF